MNTLGVVKQTTHMISPRRPCSCTARSLPLTFRFGCFVLLCWAGFVAKADTQPAPATSAVSAFLATVGYKKAPGLREICYDTCVKAKDGKCDDGRFVNTTDPVAVECDLGTDCRDCGAWYTTFTGNPTVGGPVSQLKRRQIPVWIRKVGRHVPDMPELFMPYTTHERDQGTSMDMHTLRATESQTTPGVIHVLQRNCKQWMGGKGLVLDVGAHFGWYTLLSASLGCRVIAWEPVPHHRWLLEYGVLLNNLQDSVQVRGTALYHEHTTVEVLTPKVALSKAVWGSASINGEAIMPMQYSTAVNVERVKVETETLDTIIGVDQNVVLMKLNAQGFDWSVLQGGEKMIQKKKIRNVLLEYSQGIPERKRRYDMMRKNVYMLQNLLAAGYKIGVFRLDTARLMLRNQLVPPLREVTNETLQYDLQDIKLNEEGRMGCPIPDKLKRFPSWQSCMQVPGDLHPYSLRSMGRSLRVWASTVVGDDLTLRGNAGILPFSQPTTDWFVPSSELVTFGFSVCAAMAVDKQVRHRCPCSDKSLCGEEEKLVIEASKSFQMPSNYKLIPLGAVQPGFEPVASNPTKLAAQ